MILIGVVLFTVKMPRQASSRESIITVKYWSDYASFLCCECNEFWHTSANREGYRVMDTTDVIDSGNSDVDDRNTGEDTEA